MKDNKTFLDTYKKYIRKGWYDSVFSTPTLERWCGNFIAQPGNEFDPQICAHFLLNSLIFYQEKQLEAIIVQIQDQIKRELNERLEDQYGYRLSDEDIETAWESYKAQSYIVAAALPQYVGDSAHQASRLWRNITDIDVGSVLELTKVIEQRGKKHVFFVDDFVGTGNKIMSFFSECYSENGENKGIEHIRNVIGEKKDQVDFNVAVYAIYEKGMDDVKEKYPYLNIYYGDIYTKEYNVLSSDCVLYDLFEDDKDDIIAYLNDKLQEFSVNKYVLNLPISFHHGCPNNSLPLYYASTPKWCRLLSESHPRRTLRRGG